MRRKTILTVAAIFSLAAASVQAIDFGAGIRMGLVFSSAHSESREERIEGDDDLSNHTFIGVSAGVTTRLQIAGIFALQPEALFTLAGGGERRENHEFFDDDGEIVEGYRITVDRYLMVNVPLLAAARVPVGERSWVTPYGGMSVDFLLTDPDRKTEDVEARSDLTGGAGEPIPGDWRERGYSWVAGIDIEALARGQDNTLGSLGIRYSHQIEGFGPDDVPDEDQFALRNLAITANFMYLF